MKKILSVILIALTVLSLAACADQKVEQDPVTLLQNDVIGTFGISADNQKIVSYKGENTHIKYININYNADGKVNETTHYFYNNDVDFEEAKEIYSANKAAVIDDATRRISLPSSEINTGSFKGDSDLLISMGFKIKSV